MRAKLRALGLRVTHAVAREDDGVEGPPLLSMTGGGIASAPDEVPNRIECSPELARASFDSDFLHAEEFAVTVPQT